MTKSVKYRGAEVILGWPEKIEEAQTIKFLEIDGEQYQRIPYGAETFDWNTDRPCRDCKVVAGELHVIGCAKEQCPKCGGQIFGCSCKKTEHHLH